MKTKLFLLLVIGFILSLFSCKSDLDMPNNNSTAADTENEAIAIPRTNTDLPTDNGSEKSFYDSDVFYPFLWGFDWCQHYDYIEELYKSNVGSLKKNKYPNLYPCNPSNGEQEFPPFEFSPTLKLVFTCSYVDPSGVSLPLDITFSGDDIKSFDITLYELIFSDLLVKNITPNTYYNRLNIYYDEKPILENIRLTCGISSVPNSDLSLFFKMYYPVGYSNCGLEPEYGYYRYFLLDGHPILFGEQDEFWYGERYKSAQKRRPGWDIFIQYLYAAGKIVTENDVVQPPFQHP